MDLHNTSARQNNEKYHAALPSAVFTTTLLVESLGLTSSIHAPFLLTRFQSPPGIKRVGGGFAVSLVGETSAPATLDVSVFGVLLSLGCLEVVGSVDGTCLGS